MISLAKSRDTNLVNNNMLELFHDKFQNLEIESPSRFAVGRQSRKSELDVLRKFKGQRDKIVNEVASNLQNDLYAMMGRDADAPANAEKGAFEKHIITQQLDQFIERYKALPDPFSRYLASKKKEKAAGSGYRLNPKLRDFIKKEFSPSSQERLITFEQFAFVSSERSHPLIASLLKDFRHSKQNQDISVSKLSVSEFWSKQQQVNNIKSMKLEEDKRKLMRFSSLIAKKKVEVNSKSKKADASKVQEELLDKINTRKLNQFYEEAKAVEKEQEETRRRYNNRLGSNLDLNIQLVHHGFGPTTSKFSKSLLFNKSKRKNDEGQAGLRKLASIELEDPQSQQGFELVGSRKISHVDPSQSRSNNFLDASPAGKASVLSDAHSPGPKSSREALPERLQAVSKMSHTELKSPPAFKLQKSKSFLVSDLKAFKGLDRSNLKPDPKPKHPKLIESERERPRPTIALLGLVDSSEKKEKVGSVVSFSEYPQKSKVAEGIAKIGKLMAEATAMQKRTKGDIKKLQDVQYDRSLQLEKKRRLEKFMKAWGSHKLAL